MMSNKSEGKVKVSASGRQITHEGLLCVKHTHTLCFYLLAFQVVSRSMANSQY